MKKKLTEGISPEREKVRKIWMTMRLIVFLFFVSLVHVSASVYSQKTKLNIKVENATLQQVFKTIQDQTEYDFFYKNEQIPADARVSIQSEKETVEAILDKVLNGTGLNYYILDKDIVISSKGVASTQVGQQQTVTGKVTDDSGVALPGVSVVVKGTTNGTVTSTEGTYRLSVPSEKSILVFSFIGMTAKEIEVGNQEVINVSLSEQTIGIDEVIAIGYGTTTKRTTTAAVSKVNVDNMMNLPVSSIGEALAGRTAGLIVTNSGGGLGSRPTITIRGSSTPFLNDNGELEIRTASPILIIDGVTTSNMDEMHRMNPKDIESFTVLKDAEAVAIYGSKGGNGAIVITTRRGEEGKLSINYGYSHNFSQPTVLPEKMSSYDMVRIRNEAADNDKQDRPFTDEVVQKYKDQSDPYNFPNTNWQKETLKDFAQEYKHDLSISGGDKKTKYYASLSYFDQGSLYKFNTNTLKRHTYRMSISNNFEKIGLKTNLSFFGDVEKTRAPYSHYSTGYWQTWGHIQNQDPMNPAYTDLGLYSSAVDHPLVEIDPNAGYDRNEDRNVNGQLDVEWSVPKIDGLKLKFIGYYRNANGFRKQWKVNADQYNLGSNVPNGKNTPSLNLVSGSQWRYRVQPLITFERDFDKHRIEALMGYDETYTHFDEMEASRENYVLGVDQIFAGPTETSKNKGKESEEANAGYVGRLKYSFDNKYMVEGTVRYDGNDNFPKDTRWGTFYSGSVGWIVTEEKFAHALKEKLKLDFFKLRFSYGETGIDGGVNRFDYLPGYELEERAYVVNGKVVPGFNEGSLVSRDITWYERKSINTGVDFALLNNRISGSIDYFFYETKNFLASPSEAGYSETLGIPLPKVNTEGERRRAGWEFEVKYKNNIGDLYYDIGGNLTQFDELWTNNPYEDEATLKNPNLRTTHQTGIGKRAYLNEGYYGSAEDVMASPKRNNSFNLVPGDLKYTDVNGDGQIDGEDFVRSGKPSFPRIMYGATINLSYKAWSAGMHFQGTGERHVYLGDVIRSTDANLIRYPFQTDYWTPDNTNATYPRLISNSAFNGSNNGVDSDFWLVNAKYFRMKSLQVSYDFKRDLLKNMPFSRCDLFVSGTNLFTISKIYSDYKIDPETDSGNNYGYPLQRVFSVGLNVGF